MGDHLNSGVRIKARFCASLYGPIYYKKFSKILGKRCTTVLSINEAAL